MKSAPFLFARLAALYKEVSKRWEDYRHPKGYTSLVDYSMLEYFERYAAIRDDLKNQIPELYYDLPTRALPEDDADRDFKRDEMTCLLRDMEYIFEVRANSEIGGQEINETTVDRPSRVFISHGRSSDWREVQAYIEKDLKTPTLELAQEPNRGRTVLQKLNDESKTCSFAVVVMTGDDAVDTGAPRARENVLHEIGYFQGKLGLANVCLLHEEGTSIPSNIHGLVYIPFPKGLISATYGVLARELKAALSRST
jgi:hypothetical protein